MFNLNDHKVVLQFISDLEKIEDKRAAIVIDSIDKGYSTEYLMSQVEIGMRLIFEKHGFKYYMKYENSFEITIFWRDKDEAFYHAELQKLNKN